MRHNEEVPTAVLGAAVRALEAMHRPINEETLFEAIKDRGITHELVRDFLEKSKQGQQRRPYPGYHRERL